MQNYFRVTNSIFDKDIGLTTIDKLVFIYLCRVVNGKSSGWSSYNTIADKCSIGRRTAIRSVKHLLVIGLIQVKQNGKANTYCITGIHKISNPASATLTPD